MTGEISELSPEDRIRHLANQLHPDAFRKRIDDWTRGGLPSSSIPEGSRSAEKPVPHLDKNDLLFNSLMMRYGRELARFNRAYGLGRFGQAEVALRRAVDLESGILIEEHMSVEAFRDYLEKMGADAAEDADPRAVECANPACGRPVLRTADDPAVRSEKDQRLRCRRCHRFLLKHKVERHRSLCELDVERALQKAANA